MATGRGTGHLLSATPRLDSNRVETTRPRLPVKPNAYILVSTGLVESSFPSEAPHGKIRLGKITFIAGCHPCKVISSFGEPNTT